MRDVITLPEEKHANLKRAVDGGIELCVYLCPKNS